METFLSQKNRQNVFVAFLKYLKVKYTNTYASRLYNEHPHKYNLFGLSKMLSEYNIENVAVKVNDKPNTIYELEVPFIAHIGSDFVIVNKITKEEVFYTWQGKEIHLSIPHFIEIWSGIVLMAEPSEHSIESGYKENRKKELFVILQKVVLLLALGIVFLIAYFSQKSYMNIGLTLSLLANLCGVYIGYLLTLSQLHIHSEYADKICSLFKQQDCNDVLESKAARLFGLIGWSEIGLGYFISNTIILVFLPSFINYLAIINICALPYTVWSVWYQKVKAKQWCVLCLLVQALLWIIFIINLSFGFIRIPDISISHILIVGSIYIIPMLAVNLLLPFLGEGKKAETMTQELSSIKADEEVFASLLKKQPYYGVDKTTSCILWGNKDAEILITIFSNPHCNPCASMHKRMEALLKETNHICIQYILSSFHENLDSSNKFLIAAYVNNPKETASIIFNEWFEYGNTGPEDFFRKYPQDIDNINVTQEFVRHKTWNETNRLTATPTILVNGYKLPDNYKIEDLMYFSHINLEKTFYC